MLWGYAMTLILTVLAGGAGAVARYLVDQAIQRGHRSRLPIGTLTVNVTGSFLMGCLLGSPVPKDLVTVLGTGLCGGFTTFSTASLDVVKLAVSPKLALGYLLATGVFCVLAVRLGQAVTGLM